MRLDYFFCLSETDSGASAVEYALLVAAIASIIAIAVFALGVTTDGGLTTFCTRLVAAGGPAGPC